MFHVTSDVYASLQESYWRCVFCFTYLLLVESHLLLLMIRHLVACSVIAGSEVLLLLAIDRERYWAAHRSICEVQPLSLHHGALLGQQVASLLLLRLLLLLLLPVLRHCKCVLCFSQ